MEILIYEFSKNIDSSMCSQMQKSENYCIGKKFLSPNTEINHSFKKICLKISLALRISANYDQYFEL